MARKKNNHRHNNNNKSYEFVEINMKPIQKERFSTFKKIPDIPKSPTAQSVLASIPNSLKLQPPTSQVIHHPTPLPKLLVHRTTARTIDVSWFFTPEDLDILEDDPEDLTYQLSKAEGDDPVFAFAYEGNDLRVVIDGLKPLTEYWLKLRIWDPAVNDYGKDYAEINCRTLGNI